MILACHHISKSFGTDVILDDISFHIEDYEKAAIVGINGAGKSTLLKIIMDELSADSGEVILAKGKTIGYLAQHHSRDSKRTIYEELLDVKKDVISLEKRMEENELAMKDATGTELEELLKTYDRLRHSFESQNGYAYRSEVVGVLKGLGFNEEEFNKIVFYGFKNEDYKNKLRSMIQNNESVMLAIVPRTFTAEDTVEIQKIIELRKGLFLYLVRLFAFPGYVQMLFKQIRNHNDQVLREHQHITAGKG